MANYADGARTPRTLTEREQRTLLKVTGELVVGDRLLDARGRPVEIVEITRRQGVFRVYNFEVAGLHTYFVTRLGVWSHNCAKRKGPPNPGGKLGDATTRKRTEEVKKEIESRGYDAVEERRFDTPEGDKSRRYVDVVAIDRKTGDVVEVHQVGRKTKTRGPVKRERKALVDIYNSPEFDKAMMKLLFHDKFGDG